MRSVGATVTFVVAISAACLGPRRPANVPEGAVAVTFSKAGGWAYCWVDEQQNVNRCRTYSADGHRLYRPLHEGDPDDIFVPYRGDGPIPAAELQIDIQFTQKDFVWLRNGNVLLPRNDLENQRRWVDGLMEQMKKNNQEKRR